MARHSAQVPQLEHGLSADQALERGGKLSVALTKCFSHSLAALVLEETKHALDTVSMSIAAIVRMLWSLAVRTWRDDRQDVVQEQIFAEAVAIVAFIGEQSRRLWHRHGHQTINTTIIGRLAARQVEAEREALIVAAGMDLARKAAA